MERFAVFRPRNASSQILEGRERTGKTGERPRLSGTARLPKCLKSPPLMPRAEFSLTFSSFFLSYTKLSVPCVHLPAFLLALSQTSSSTHNQLFQSVFGDLCRSLPHPLSTLPRSNNGSLQTDQSLRSYGCTQDRSTRGGSATSI